MNNDIGFVTKEFGPVKIFIGTYPNNRPAICLVAQDGTMAGVLTVNIPHVPLDEGEVLVKAWEENEQIAKDALSTGLFVDTGKRCATGYVQAQVWKAKQEVFDARY